MIPLDHKNLDRDVPYFSDVVRCVSLYLSLSFVPYTGVSNHSNYLLTPVDHPATKEQGKAEDSRQREDNHVIHGYLPNYSRGINCDQAKL